MVDFKKIAEENREIRARIAKQREKLHQDIELEDSVFIKWALRDAIREIANLKDELKAHAFLAEKRIAELSGGKKTRKEGASDA